MITHSVFFKLKHPAGSAEEAAFLTEAQKLAVIPGVGNFQVLKETSPKNDFAYGLTMTFENQAAYDAYNNHPDHVAFVQQIWLKEVEAFQEIDHVPFGK
ncbi:Dabb family protein [Verrucomicrobia bacterium S94]|nr:Dabb family protein [Verrucomicrobia bacterium S94]